MASQQNAASADGDIHSTLSGIHIMRRPANSSEDIRYISIAITVARYRALSIGIAEIYRDYAREIYRQQHG